MVNSLVTNSTFPPPSPTSALTSALEILEFSFEPMAVMGAGAGVVLQVQEVSKSRCSEDGLIGSLSTKSERVPTSDFP